MSCSCLSGVLVPRSSQLFVLYVSAELENVASMKPGDGMQWHIDVSGNHLLLNSAPCVFCVVSPLLIC